jgi:acyl transferase domain-containing protein
MRAAGHTEPVSGLAAVIKTAFALQHACIPPNLNYEKPNFHDDMSVGAPVAKVIDRCAWRFILGPLGGQRRDPTLPTQWPQDKSPRASINNFGYGGTNAHIIMERALQIRGDACVLQRKGGFDNGRQPAHGLSMPQIRLDVEAHMTGTATGDPIEAEAIARTFGQRRSSDDPVRRGGSTLR